MDPTQQTTDNDSVSAKADTPIDTPIDTIAMFDDLVAEAANIFGTPMPGEEEEEKEATEVVGTESEADKTTSDEVAVEMTESFMTAGESMEDTKSSVADDTTGTEMGHEQREEGGAENEQEEEEEETVFGCKGTNGEPVEEAVLPLVTGDTEIGVPAELTTAEKCSLCILEFKSESAAEIHYAGKKHQKKKNEYISRMYKQMGINPDRFLVSVPEVEDFDAEIEDTPIILVRDANEEFFEKYKFACSYCNLFFKKQDLLEQHERGAMHAVRVWERQKGLSLDSMGTKKWWPDDFYCSICEKELNSKQQYEQHMISKKHLANEKKIMEKTNQMGDHRNLLPGTYGTFVAERYPKMGAVSDMGFGGGYEYDYDYEYDPGYMSHQMGPARRGGRGGLIPMRAPFRGRSAMEMDFDFGSPNIVSPLSIGELRGMNRQTRMPYNRAAEFRNAPYGIPNQGARGPRRKMGRRPPLY